MLLFSTNRFEEHSDDERPVSDSILKFEKHLLPNLYPILNSSA